MAILSYFQLGRLKQVRVEVRHWGVSRQVWYPIVFLPLNDSVKYWMICRLRVHANGRKGYSIFWPFGPLKEYDDELMVLNCLLSQKYWRRGKRANWYVRRAIIRKNYWLLDKDDKLRFESVQGIC